MLERIKLLFHKASSRDDQPDESVIVAAIERVVDGTDPRLRLIGGYRRKLRKAVTRALAYTHRLVETIPPPVEMGRKTFVKDPHVYAFFASVERLQEVFSHSIPLTEFFQHPENTALNECYAFLVMEKEEKRVFGVELEGEIVKRDVPRIAINFSGHRLIAPGTTEAATRQELRERAFNHLVECALENILSLQSRKQELESQRSLLKVKLKMLQAEQRGLEALSGEGEIEQSTMTVTEQKLADIEQELRESAADLRTLDGYLRRVNHVLHHPEDYLRLRLITLRLNRMGIKLDQSGSTQGEEIMLVKAEIGARGQARSAVGVLVTYSREELLSTEHYLDKADRYIRSGL